MCLLNKLRFQPRIALFAFAIAWVPICVYMVVVRPFGWLNNKGWEDDMLEKFAPLLFLIFTWAPIFPEWQFTLATGAVTVSFVLFFASWIMLAMTDMEEDASSLDIE